MNDVMKEKMEEIREIQKKVASKKLPDDQRAKLNSLLQEKLRSAFAHADDRRARLRRTFRRPIRRAR